MSLIISSSLIIVQSLEKPVNILHRLCSDFLAHSARELAILNDGEVIAAFDFYHLVVVTLKIKLVHIILNFKVTLRKDGWNRTTVCAPLQ